MSASFASARVDDTRWAAGPPPGADELDQLVYLSNLVGREPGLVQPGGGTTSIRRGAALGARAGGPARAPAGGGGFPRLSLPALMALRDAAAMSDAEMMRFMASCTLHSDGGGPPPSVETPLHALLPRRVIVHTHDVATMSLTNLNDATAERLVGELFEGEIVYVPYVRPGFPLAQTVSTMVDRIPPGASGLALAHHGLTVWGDDSRECYAHLVRVVNRIADYLETRRRGRAVAAATARPMPAPEARRRCAEVVLPVVRGMLGSTGGGVGRVILYLDDSDDMLRVLAHESLQALVRRGMATPEHILRAGRLPLWLELDPSAPPDQLAEAVRSQISRQRVEYEEYHRRHAEGGERPLDDWAKVVLAPGVGMITAFRDKRGAVTANLCYRAVLETITNAEAIGGVQFIFEGEGFAVEHRPLERRQNEEQGGPERASLRVPPPRAAGVGGGGGAGAAGARRARRRPSGAASDRAAPSSHPCPRRRSRRGGTPWHTAAARPRCCRRCASRPSNWAATGSGLTPSTPTRSTRHCSASSPRSGQPAATSPWTSSWKPTADAM